MKNFFPIQKSGVEPFSILAAALSPKYNCPQILIVVDCRSTKVFHGEHFSAEIPAIPVFYSLSTDCGRRLFSGELLTIQTPRPGLGPAVPPAFSAHFGSLAPYADLKLATVGGLFQAFLAFILGCAGWRRLSGANVCDAGRRDSRSAAILQKKAPSIGRG
jgi:hypothetical protein